MPGGSLPVTEGDQVVPLINDLLDLPWDIVAFTQDYHPLFHVSFASTHHLEPYEPITLWYTEDAQLCNFTADVFDYLVGDEALEVCDVDGEAAHEVSQMLWPDHCIQNTTEGALHEDLAFNPGAHYLIRKGYENQIDAYSGFFDNGHFRMTELPALFEEAGVTNVYVVGLAYDYCVSWTAKDARALGYKVAVIQDATRGIDPETMQQATDDMTDLGIEIIDSSDLLESIS
ncbi:hypothetical protein N2152v2_008930 [Parachlorella kessleri]